jgi:hypothetical protein
MNAKFNVEGDTKSTLGNDDGGREEKAMVKVGNNNKHGTRSCGQRISNSTLTCRVELRCFSSSSSTSIIDIFNLHHHRFNLHHHHHQPPSSSTSSTSIIIPP